MLNSAQKVTALRIIMLPEQQKKAQEKYFNFKQKICFQGNQLYAVIQVGRQPKWISWRRLSLIRFYGNELQIIIWTEIKNVFMCNDTRELGSYFTRPQKKKRKKQILHRLPQRIRCLEEILRFWNFFTLFVQHFIQWRPSKELLFIGLKSII